MAGLLLLLGLAVGASGGGTMPPAAYERQRYDGWYNNLAHPAWGAVDGHLVRKTPPSYADGVYMMSGADRPSPRNLSQAFMRGADGLASLKNRTAMQTFFGQVVSAEILRASEAGCPIEMHKIPIVSGDEMYDAEGKGDKFMPFHRAGYDTKTGQSPNMPREQKNTMTSWIDGSFVYSTKESWVSAMRSFENGTLKMEGSKEKGMPPLNSMRVPMENAPAPHLLTQLNPERMYLLGDPRTNQNPAFLVMGILFYRWHNYQAARVKEVHPDWSDEDVFQAARRRVIASLQTITMYEYLPAFMGTGVDPYTGYKPDTHPGISHVFQSAAFRFGHTMIPPGIYRRRKGEKGTCDFVKARNGGPAMRLCSSWWDAEGELTPSSVDEILMGLSSQITEREDPILCSDVRNNLFGPMEFSRRDLASLNIMRGRDNGLPDYNTVRKCFGFPMMNNFSEINPEQFAKQPDIFNLLEEEYKGDLMNIDLYVGGMLESYGGPGPLFTKIIKEQFERLRDSDRFWFENKENDLFSASEIEALRKLKLSDIIKAVTDIKHGDIQENVFFHQEGDPCPQPHQLNATLMEPCMFLKGYDYFQGSEVPYVFGCIVILFIPVALLCSAYGVVKIMNSRRRKIKMKWEVGDKKGTDKMYVKEWLHHSAKRNAKITFGPDEAFHLMNRKGEKLRSVSVKGLENLVCQVTQDRDKKPMLLISVEKDHDLVLEFSNNVERKKLLTKMETFLQSYKKRLETVPTYKDEMLAGAETKERRKARLEHFFREAYALTFGLKPGEKRKAVEVDSDVMMVMRTSLSMDEFASALGMKATDVFVKKMFAIVDKDNDNRISFQEFLDMIVIFSKGRTDDKLQIVFNMCDTDKNGTVDKEELSELFHSLVDISKTERLSKDQVTELINSMFKAAGFNEKEELTYDDFKLMMKEHKGDFLAIGLDCKGAKLNFLDTTTNVARMQSFAVDAIAERHRHWFFKKWDMYTSYLENYRQCIFYIFVFYVITIALFVERFIFYAFMGEHRDLRHIMGIGIAITRGAAAALSFNYSVLLLTVCRNLITKMKEWAMNQYIPLDSNIHFHKIVACTALFFSVLHSVGHLVNFYHVGTQPIEHLLCLSKEINFSSDRKPDIAYWFFQTLTGLSGVVLWITMCAIYIFALPFVRDRAYNFFWKVHQLYVLLYFLCIIHGMARITSSPQFWIFFCVPCVIYTLDKVVTLRRSYMELDILETEILPSDVIKIRFYRPPSMKVLSGQWIRFTCTAIEPEEFHSLTLTSAPHEDFLQVHLKALGPWTWKLRNFFDKKFNDKEEDKDNPPKIRIEGPFGGGNQDWYKFEVAVMVGGGIGVTPYASVLNDLVFGTSTNRYSGVACKKVYFLWICPSHRYFEWFIDVLRDVERKDVTNVLEMHIFITQFYHKFDLRTTMLYIIENHFQRLCRRSMFTGLKAINHFGRPDMPSFLKFVQKKHSYVSKVGVFTCGGAGLTKSVVDGIESVNRARKVPYFTHHYEEF